MDPNKTMTFTDSEICTCYQFPSKAYPRFSYVQDSLKSFFPRFLRTFEKLPQCLKWMDIANGIGKSVALLIEKQPEIILFGQKHSQIQKDIIVASSVLEQDCKRETFDRTKLHLHISNTTPQVLVYTCRADQNLHQELEHLEKELSSSGLDNVLVLLDAGKQSKQEAQVLVEEVIKSLPDAARDKWSSKMIQNMPQNTVSTEISNILELWEVRGFQETEKCIKEVLSVQREHLDGRFIFGEMYLVSSLSEFLQDVHIAKDLMGVSNKMDQSNSETSTDQFLQDEYLATDLMDVSNEMDETNREGSSDQFLQDEYIAKDFMDVSNEMDETNREGSSDQFLQGEYIAKDFMDVSNEMDETNREGSTDQFTSVLERIVQFIERAVTVQFSAIFKIATWLVHNLLEDIKFQEKCMKSLSATTREGIQSDLKEKQMAGAELKEKPKNKNLGDPDENRAKDLLRDIKIVLSESEGFIRGVHESLMTLNHLQVELNGVLLHTVIHRKKECSFPKMQEHKQASKIKKDVSKTDDPFEFWLSKLIILEDVQGCCDYYGKLMVFISKQSSIDKEQVVKQEISKCLTGCPYDYDVKIGTKPQTFANPNQAENDQQASIFSAGQKICWNSDDGDCRHGTLGIFLQTSNDETTVYLVTNGHVAPHMGRVLIISNDGVSEEIGNKAWGHISNLIDIAAVKVKPDLITKCMFDIENYKNEECSYVILGTDCLQSEDLVGQKVFKKGAETGPKMGIISSRTLMYWKDQMIKKYNVLVEPLPGSDPDEVFAKKGDSGSVVSLCRPFENPACIVAMLIGGLDYSPTLSQMAYSEAEMQNIGKLCFSFFLQNGIRVLNTEFQLDLDVELTYELLNH